MTKEQFLKLQVGMFITDHEDINSPENYCMILQFKGTQIQLQPYDSFDEPATAHPYWEDYRDINLTEKLYASEYKRL